MEDFGGAFRVMMSFSHSLEAKCSRGKRAHCVCVRNNRMLAPLVTVNWKDTHYVTTAKLLARVPVSYQYFI